MTQRYSPDRSSRSLRVDIFARGGFPVTAAAERLTNGRHHFRRLRLHVETILRCIDLPLVVAVSLPGNRVGLRQPLPERLNRLRFAFPGVHDHQIFWIGKPSGCNIRLSRPFRGMCDAMNRKVRCVSSRGIESASFVAIFSGGLDGDVTA